MLIHPLVYDSVSKMLTQRYNPIVFIDVPLLYEAHFDDLTDTVVVVYANEALQKTRLMHRNGLLPEEADIRFFGQ